MAERNLDPQLLLFRRQYLQLFEPDFLAWPPTVLLKDVDVQAWLSKNLFDADENSRLPPDRYRYRVLKQLVARIEKSIQDPEIDEISDDLMSQLSVFMASSLPSELTAVQQKSYVTFTCLPPFRDAEDSSSEPTITLLERRNLISGSLTTGFRTWEASLHLGSYLLKEENRNLIRNKSVLELGAGTGFLSVLCAKHLAARHVTSTDGDEGVVETLRENLFLNELDDDKRILTSVLRWGQGLRGTWLEEVNEEWPFDVIIGADITYEKLAISALVASLRMMFDLRPSLQVIISGAIRNLETFETFRHACLRNKFNIKEVSFDPPSIRDQKALFYATFVPLKILSITAPSS